MNEAKKELIISEEPQDQMPATQPDRPKTPEGVKPSTQRPDFATNKKDEIISHLESSQGTEVIIYQTPQELPESSNFHIVIYVFIQLGSEILAKLIVAALIISAYSTPSPGFAPIALFIIIFNFWKIALNLFYYIAFGARVPEFRKAYVFDIMLSIGYIVIFWALFAYFKGNLTPANLPLFVIPHIILTLIRMCAGEAMQTPYLPGSIFAFLESLQILYIALKLSNPPAHSDWTWVLLFFYVVTILFLIVAFILMIVLIIFLFMIVFQSEIIRDIPNLIILVSCGIIFYVVWNGISMYYLVSGFQLLADANQIGPKPPTGEMNPRLYHIGWFMLVCAAITLILILFVYCYLKDALLNYFNKSKPKEISLQSFAQSLNINIKKVSNNYFKRNTGDEENPGSKMQQSAGPNNTETCMICVDKPSDVLLHPCGHSGVCEACLKEYIKEKDDCPMCREKIEKAYLIFYDETKKGFMARGVIKIKR
jgi:hypothetical protein